MSWKRTNAKQEKLKFIGDWLKQDANFSVLCLRYGISRKTGYKLINRYEEEGGRAFDEKSHTRHVHPNETNKKTRSRLIVLKLRYPKWGPAKIRDWLLLNEPEQLWPATSTIGDIFKKHHLVRSRKYRRHVPNYTEPFLDCEFPNQVWSADFKGQFCLGNAGYCYPLTISDNHSRFLLLCEGLVGPTLKSTMKCFKNVFNEYGLPEAIRTDNGQPFAGVGIGGLTQLSIWWLKLGILPERIEPGHPEQNGRHERMHRTLKEATASPPCSNFKDQQHSFNTFKNEYNEERPHQALKGKRPSDVYQSSLRSLPDKLLEVTYPDHFEIRMVRTNGEIKLCGKKYYITGLLHKEPVGLEQVDDGTFLVYFGKLKLGIADARADKIIRP